MWKYAIPMCLLCDGSTIFPHVPSHVAVQVLVFNSNMLIYVAVAVHVEVRHSHESFFHRQYNIPTCFSMLQCTFKVNNFHVLIYVAVHVEVRHPSGPQRAAGAVLAELRSCGLQRGGVPSLGTGHGIPYHRCNFL